MAPNRAIEGVRLPLCACGNWETAPVALPGLTLPASGPIVAAAGITVTASQASRRPARPRSDA